MSNIIKKSLKTLTLDPQNARLHTTENIEAIKSSLANFGLRKPVVINTDNIVLAGNGTVRAARELGWTHIECHIFTGTPEEERAYAIADNRAAELASWDETGLAELLTGLESDLLEAAGYTTDTVDDLLASIQEETEINLPDIDTRFTSMVSRSVICTYPRSEYDLVIGMFEKARALHGHDSNSETLALLLDLKIG
jgi:ParB-like chromosome segregation protein Spo0J